ncbi:MAG: hypothetical protein KDA87_11660 [Planctomycetales bacterium]|nr:hypothetical protein [Planctomycetales bacterium]
MRSTSLPRLTQRIAVTAGLLVWLSAMSLVTASLMVSHWVPLPQPEADSPELAAKLNQAITAPAPTWRAFHFLYSDCPCSRRVLRKILERSPMNGVVERIVLVGRANEWETRIRDLGYEFHPLDSVELESNYGIRAVPSLVVVSAAGNICYSGGYTARKQGPDIADQRIIQSVLAGEDIESFPVYGCAVAKNLQDIVDPLGLKYTSETAE